MAQALRRKCVALGCGCVLTLTACWQMESYQQQLKEQQSKLQKASKQAQEAAAKAAAQEQVSIQYPVILYSHPFTF